MAKEFLWWQINIILYYFYCGILAHLVPVEQLPRPVTGHMITATYGDR